MYKLLSDSEMDAFVSIIGQLDPGGLEDIYRGELLPSVLPRATPGQREKLYSVFKRTYTVKSKHMDHPIKKTVLDQRDWYSPGGKAVKTTELEEEHVKHMIQYLGPDELKRYMSFVRHNVFPRVVGYHYSTPDAYRKSMEELYVYYLRKKEYHEREAKNIRDDMRNIASNMPPIGTTVTMDGSRGIVIDRGYTRPQVKVRWEDETSTWVDISYLKW
mgnify:CR=1 FL=1